MRLTTSLLALIALFFVPALVAHADTYQIFEIGNANQGAILGIDDLGNVAVATPCASPVCWDVYANGVFSYQTTSSAVPDLDFDNGTPCAIPPGFAVGSASVCNNGRVVLGTRYNPNNDPAGIYSGLYSDPQFVTGLFADNNQVYLNSIGDFAWTDGVDETNYVAIDLTTSAVPEPSSIAFLGTGLIGLVGIARRRFLS